jgi:hypothetical protein
MRGAHGVIALLVAGGLSIDDGARAVATALFERLREKLLRDGQELRVVRAQWGWAYCGRILVALLLASRFGTGHGHEEDQPDSPAIPCSFLPPFVEDTAPEWVDFCAARWAWIVALLIFSVYPVFMFLNRGQYDDKGKIKELLQRDSDGKIRKLVKDFSAVGWALSLARSVCIMSTLLIYGIGTALLAAIGWGWYVVFLLLGTVLVWHAHYVQGKTTPPQLKPLGAKALDYANSLVATTMVLQAFGSVALVYRGDQPLHFMVPFIIPLAPLYLAVLDALVRCRSGSFEGPKLVFQNMGVYYLCVLSAEADMLQYAFLHWATLSWGTKPDQAQTATQDAISTRLRLQRKTRHFVWFVLIPINAAAAFATCWLAMIFLPAPGGWPCDPRHDCNTGATNSNARIAIWVMASPIGFFFCLAGARVVKLICVPIARQWAREGENNIGCAYNLPPMRAAPKLAVLTFSLCDAAGFVTATTTTPRAP